MRILNLGCGSDTYGTDFIDLKKMRKEVIQCNIDKEKLPYGDNTFDEVYFYQVLQFIKNPLFVLKEIHRVLKFKGILNLYTLNKDFLGWRLPNNLDKDIDKVSTLFSMYDLFLILSFIGYKIIKYNYKWYLKRMNRKYYLIYRKKNLIKLNI
jgi:ubiquinone/menaquinone biosynthesis C-methylase UbiE